VEDGCSRPRLPQDWGTSTRRSTARRPIRGGQCWRKAPFRETGVQTSAPPRPCPAMGVNLANGVELATIICAGGRRHSDPKANDNSPQASLPGRDGKIPRQTESQEKRPVILVGRHECGRRWKTECGWNHKQLLGIVSHTPVENKLLGEAQAAFRLDRHHRHFIPPGGKNLQLVELSAPPTGRRPTAVGGWIMSGPVRPERRAQVSQDRQEDAWLGRGQRSCARSSWSSAV